MKRKLIIPEHITLRWELIPGVGRSEIIKILLFGVPCALFCFLMSKQAPTPIASVCWLLGIILGFCVGYAFFARLSGNMSIWQLIMRWYRFFRAQEKFYFRGEDTICDSKDRS